MPGDGCDSQRLTARGRALPHRAGSRRHRAARERGATNVDRRARWARTGTDARTCAPDAHAPRPPVRARRLRRSPPSRLVLLVVGDPISVRGGGCDLVPVNFSEMPLLLRRVTKHPIVLAAASPPDPHGYVSLGTNADYPARFIGQLPFFIEVNPQMPRTFGENSLHLSQVVGWTEADSPSSRCPQRKCRPRIDTSQRRGRPRTGRSDDSGRDRRDSQRDSRAVDGPSEPRPAHGADL